MAGRAVADITALRVIWLRLVLYGLFLEYRLGLLPQGLVDRSFLSDDLLHSLVVRLVWSRSRILVVLHKISWIHYNLI